MVDFRIGARSARPPHAVDQRDQDQRQQPPSPAVSDGRGEAAIERDHHARQQQQERQHPRQHVETLGHGEIVALEDGGGHAGLGIDGAGGSIFFTEMDHRIGAEQRDQQQAGSDAGQEQPRQRFFRRHREQDHGDRWRQQNAERAAGGDDAGGEAAGITALAHFRNAGRADRRTGGGRRSCHRREQRAGKHVGDAEPAGDAMQPGMQRRIQVLAGAGAADRSALENEQRDRQQRDRGHFLVDVLGNGIERGRGHVDAHEHHGDRAQRERDRMPENIATSVASP